MANAMLAQGICRCGERRGLLAEWRSLVCGAIIVVVPASLIGQSTDRAILHSSGGVSLNKSPAPPTSAIFPDYLIETQKENVATIDAEGSRAMVQPETVVQFEVDELDLDHGFLQLTTSRQMRVRVNCLTVVPISADPTQYDVIDMDGKVKVIAYKNDVKIHLRSSVAHKAKRDESSDVIVREGHQTTRDEHCAAAAKPTEGVTADGAILTSRRAIWAGVGGIALLCILICRGDDPISPSGP
jgi:hypothetical protein